MCNAMSPWEKAVDFHGHICPGLAIGYRAAMEAMRRLKQERAGDEEVVAIVETDACGVDAVQVITGCTFGKGNFFFRDVGKQAFSFGVRGKEEGVRIVLKHGVMEKLAAPEWKALREKVFGKTATAGEQNQFQEFHKELTDKILNEPLENIMEVNAMQMDFPPHARIFETVECAFCGEGVMEPRAGLKQSKPACCDCV